MVLQLLVPHFVPVPHDVRDELVQPVDPVAPRVDALPELERRERRAIVAPRDQPVDHLLQVVIAVSGVVLDVRVLEAHARHTQRVQLWQHHPPRIPRLLTFTLILILPMLASAVLV